MHQFLKETQKTDQIELIDLNQLKKDVEVQGEEEGAQSINKYRLQVAKQLQGKRPIVTKGQIVHIEHQTAEMVIDKNPKFGFKVLHYSVSEAVGDAKILVLNKTGKAGKVRVRTVEGDAKAGDDFEALDTVIEFKDKEFE